MTTINNKESKEFVKAIFDALRSEGEVKVTGIGVFAVRRTKERQGVNPKTGERITISPRNVIKFRASSTLKQEIASYNNSNGSQNENLPASGQATA